MVSRTSSKGNFTNPQISFEEEKKHEVPNAGITDLGFNNKLLIGADPITNIDEYKRMSRNISPDNKKATRGKLESIINNTAGFDNDKHE